MYVMRRLPKPVAICYLSILHTCHLLIICIFSEQANYLGISIVGQSNKGGDGGIYVGSIMKG